jgi:hypothetical protein
MPVLSLAALFSCHSDGKRNESTRQMPAQDHEENCAKGSMVLTEKRAFKSLVFHIPKFHHTAEFGLEETQIQSTAAGVSTNFLSDGENKQPEKRCGTKILWNFS